MNREIKLRVWDGSNWTYFKIGQHMTPFVLSVYNDHCLNGRRFFEYTGLKDGTGKEIYEGDVLQSIISDSFFNWIVEWSDSLAGFVVVNIGIEGYLGDRFAVKSKAFFSDRIIIGNIHDNPELLKP
jgi:uncharacterized phage protein (TIGR01671 family)